MISALGATATPSDDGFYFPADDARQAQIWLPWPRESALQEAVAALVRIILPFQPVSLVVSPGEETAARAACGPVTIVALAHDSLRLRDTGPCFLVDGKGGSAAADLSFGGWGGRAQSTADKVFAHELLGLAEVRRFRTPLQLEASAFTTDGEGTLLALADCVFDPARNPGVGRLEAFAILLKWLGGARVIWLEKALPTDNLRTDLRAIAAFLAPGIVALSRVPDDHPHAPALRAARAALMRAKDAQGRTPRVVDLDAPEPVMRDARVVAASYTNFLAINGAILVPAFAAESDGPACEVLRQFFPDREVIAVPALELAAHGLTLTSVAVPQPARLLQRDRATTLPRSAWSRTVPDIDALLQKYIDMARD